jgi:hypothetical protein
LISRNFHARAGIVAFGYYLRSFMIERNLKVGWMQKPLRVGINQGGQPDRSVAVVVANVVVIA